MEDAMQLECKPEQERVSEMSPGGLLGAKEGGGRQRSDEELVIAAQSGESCALGELFCRHQKMLYSFARRYSANADEARDLVQETMLRAIRNIGRFRKESRFSTWLGSIVINAAISNRRREKHIRWIALDEQEGEDTRFCMRELRDVRRNPEEDYSHRELRGLLRREALKLHPKYRFILKACDLDDCSIKQAAHSLGMHLGSAKSRLHRARRSLSAAMRKSGAVGTNTRIRRIESESVCRTIG
jgi:RNA polymerase sigma-70 factor (ECF subfamily)